MEQLKKKIKLYDSIYDGSMKIADILIHIDRENINFRELLGLFDIIYKMHKSMQSESISNINANDYFKRIDYSFIDTIKSEYELALELINTLTGIYPGTIDNLETCIKKLNTLQEEVKNSNKIKSVSVFLGIWNTLELYKKGNYNGIYNIILMACLEYKNDMVKYVNSLELPTKSDWE